MTAELCTGQQCTVQQLLCILYLHWDTAAHIGPNSGQGGGGSTPDPFTLRQHSMNEHGRQLQPSPSGRAPLSLPCFQVWRKCAGCPVALFCLLALERHPQQSSFPSFLGLGSDKLQVQPAFCHCLLPSTATGKAKESGFVLQVLQKW